MITRILRKGILARVRTNPSANAAAATTVAGQLLRGVRWGRCGWDEVRRDVPRWVGMSCLYLVPAALLARLPFAGPLLVLLLSPMMAAGVLLAAERGDTARAGKGSHYERWAAGPGRALLAALVDEKRVYPAVLLGIITLGLVVLMFIVEHLFGFGSAKGLLSASARNAAPLWSIVLGLAGAAILHVLLAMGLFFAVHRTMLAGRDPMTAMSDSFTACTQQPVALLALGGLFALPYLLIALAFSVSAILGYLLLFTLGVFALPAFIAASLCSYREVFPARS